MALTLGLASSTFAETPKPLATVEATITGVRSTKGNVLVCMTTNAKAYPSCGKDPKSLKLALPAHATMTARFEDVPPGTYAIALIHDENGNKKLDLAMFIPKEGFGMSRNPKIGMGPPSFKSAAFVVGVGDVRLPITMKYML